MELKVIYSPGIDDLDHVRVTGLQTLEKCPRTWWNDQFRGGGTDNKWSLIGTAAHKVCEMFLNGYDLTPAREIIAATEMSVDEQWNLNAYLETLRPVRAGMVLGTEIEFRMRVPGFDKDIVGHIDCASVDVDGWLLITDHKTNRSFESVDEWRVKLQPLLYTYAARNHLWPGFPGYRFRIGYINQSQALTWDTSPADDVAVEKRLQGLWAEVCEYQRAGNWPEKFNDSCQYCALRDRCYTFYSQMNSLIESFEFATQKRTHEENYLWVSRIASAASRIKSELEERLRQKINDNQSVQCPEGRFELEQGYRRAVKYTDLQDTLYADHGDNPLVYTEEDESILADLAEEIYTVKVGGLDKLIKRRPHWGERLSEVMTAKPNKEPTLKFVPAPLTQSVDTQQVLGDLQKRNMTPLSE